MASKLPTVTQPIRMEPDMARLLEDELRPYEGDDLKTAQDAILEARKAGPFTFDGWRKHYHVAIQTALDPDYDRDADPFFDAYEFRKPV